MAETHPRGADQLGLAEDHIDEVRRGFAQQGVEQEHETRSHEEADHRGREHGQHDLGPEAGGGAVGEGFGPVQHAPASVGGGERGTAEPANECVAGTGRQAEPPGEKAPHDRSPKRTQNSGHRDGAGIDQALADGRGDGGAGQGSDQIEEGRECDGLAGREHLGRHDRGDRVGGVVEAVDVFKHQCRQQNDEEKRHDAGMGWGSRLRSTSGRSGRRRCRRRGSGR